MKCRRSHASLGKLLAWCLAALLPAGSAAAVTVFQSFAQDVVANPGAGWNYVRQAQAWGGISYVAVDGQGQGQYLQCLLARNDTPDSTCRLYMMLDSAMTAAQECWFEFDFRTHEDNTGYYMSALGLIESARTLDQGFDYLCVGQGSNRDVQAMSAFDGGAGTTYPDDNAGFTTTTYVVGQPYRAKAHFYLKPDGHYYMALSLYELAGNAEIVIEEETTQTAVLVPPGAGFSPGLDAFGIFNTIGSPKSGATGHRYDVDNIYFSTEGPNTQTCAPFIPQLPEEPTVGPENLIGHWTFDDPDAVGADISGHGNHGAVHGSTTWTSDAALGEGAVVLDGSVGSHVQLFPCNELAGDFSTGQATIAFWVRCTPGAPQTAQGLGAVGCWAYPTYYPGTSGTAPFKFFLSDGPAAEARLLPTVDVNQWHHLAITVDAANVTSGYRIYENGRLIGTWPMDGSLGNFLPPVTPRLGVTYDAPARSFAYFQGSIDEVRLYNLALPEMQVRELYSPADINLDAGVDLADFAALAAQWLEHCDSPGWCGFVDLNRSGSVEWDDLSLMLENWLRRRP